jgi:hypothetical protein
MQTPQKYAGLFSTEQNTNKKKKEKAVEIFMLD